MGKVTLRVILLIPIRKKLQETYFLFTTNVRDRKEDVKIGSETWFDVVP